MARRAESRHTSTSPIEIPIPEQITDFSPYLDGFLTDTWEPSTKNRGVTGKTHDWEISKALVAYSAKPLILAGGLTPENVYEAVKQVAPWGVDSHTGLEGAGGKKDPAKVLKFIAETKRAYSGNMAKA